MRVERLNEISEEGARLEGVIAYGELWKDYINGDGFYIKTAKRSFMTLWESINGKDSFDNRWVWVVEFQPISKEEAMG